MPENNLRREIYFENPSELEKNDITKEINNTIADIKAGRYDKELQNAGIARDGIDALKSDFLEVEIGQELIGVEVAVIAILVKEGAKISGKILTDVWSRIILPRIEARYGSRIHRDKPSGS